MSVAPQTPNSAAPIVNAMSVDVEDYFQVEALAGVISRDAWNTIPRRVAANTDRLLDLFAETGARATFFTLAWVAERHPDLIRRIVAAGHELASHGLDHTRVDRQTPDAFRADLRRSRGILEDVGGVAIAGYRAASFSIGARNLWAFDVLEAEGYAYSSSVYPIQHDLYGMPDAPRMPFRPRDGALLEIPLTTVRRFGRNLPCAGGGYFRLMPYWLSRANLRRVHRADRVPAVFYLHPWEVDPGQPRVAGLGVKSRLRHYLNLGAMEGRLRQLLRDFAWDRMDRVFLGRTEP
ncbi:MAG TPA: XrtA system polysaccharide deacetylase [Stellaceae bacterium]|jgi:polysaccharide deacetylase family protein (PEP-CTERM system associated)|nr:XrtA system polysaccharide deacetylase [Stellaceae bacterium]